MILKSVIMENIRSYEHEEVQFARGTSLFSGDIGSGKSTVLMAVEFALFGLNRKSSDLLLSKRRDSGYVLLEFEAGGKTYEIRRTLGRKSSGKIDQKDLWIRYDGIKDSTMGVGDMKRKVLEILKFDEPPDPRADSRIFRYAVFTPQESMKEVLADEDKRRDTIRRAFNIDGYKVAQDNATMLAGDIEGYAKTIAERFRKMDQLEAGISDAMHKKEESVKRYDEAVLEQERFERQESEKKAERKEMEQEERNMNRMRESVSGLNARIQEKINQRNQAASTAKSCREEINRLEERKERIPSMDRPDTEMTMEEIMTEMARVNGVRVRMAELETLRNVAREQIDSLQAEPDAASARTELERLENERMRLSLEIESANTNRDEMMNSKAKADGEVNRLRDEESGFKRLEGMCTVCKQPIDKKHSHDMMERIAASIASLEVELKSATQAVNSLDAEIAGKRKDLEACREGIIKAKKAADDVAKRDQKLEEVQDIERHIHALKNQGGSPDEYKRLERLRTDLSKYEKCQNERREIQKSMDSKKETAEKSMGDAEKLDAEIGRAREEMGGMNEKLEVFGDLAERIQKNRADLGNIEEGIRSVTGRKATHKEAVEQEERRLSEYEGLLAECKRWKAEHAKLEQFAEWLRKFFIPSVKKIEEEVMITTWDMFNKRYREFYASLVEDPTKESKINENFAPAVSQDGYDQRIEAMSGGEKTSIALAYRLTLNKMMRDRTDAIQSGLLILDEPTDGFSSSQMGKIRGLLDEMNSEQIILVSHDQELESYADRVYHVAKQNGVSAISVKPVNPLS